MIESESGLVREYISAARREALGSAEEGADRWTNQLLSKRYAI
jgi:hypothetical protein